MVRCAFELGFGEARRPWRASEPDLLSHHIQGRPMGAVSVDNRTTTVRIAPQTTLGGYKHHWYRSFWSPQWNDDVGAWGHPVGVGRPAMPAALSGRGTLDQCCTWVMFHYPLNHPSGARSDL